MRLAETVAAVALLDGYTLLHTEAVDPQVQTNLVTDCVSVEDQVEQRVALKRTMYYAVISPQYIMYYTVVATQHTMHYTVAK